MDCFNFSDGEIFVQLHENVRGADTYVIQPTCNPVNENLMELLIMLDAIKRSSASRVTAVIPYYGYARQDKKDAPRVPITAKLVADLLSQAGADRILTLDLHAPQIQAYFDMPVDHLFATPVLLEAIRALGIPDLVIVSPDAGGVERARAVAKRLNCGLAIVDKRRTAPNEASIMHIIGDVKDRSVLILDDIIDTAGTLTHTVDALKEKGRGPGFRGRYSRSALRPCSQTHRKLAHRANLDYRHHSPRRKAGTLRQVEAVFCCSFARRGDSTYSQQQLGQLPFCVSRRIRSSFPIH